MAKQNKWQHIVPFQKRLRELGYKRKFADKDVQTYEKQETPIRRVDVQLWFDGKHRASHFFRRKEYESMCTHPTEFETVEGMERAIKRELDRTDHPPTPRIAK